MIWISRARLKAADILETQESPVAPEIRAEIDDYLDYVVGRDVEGRTAGIYPASDLNGEHGHEHGH